MERFGNLIYNVNMEIYKCYVIIINDCHSTECMAQFHGTILYVSAVALESFNQIQVLIDMI